VRVRSVQDDHNLDDAIRVVLIGERNTEDSKRKALATRDGLKRRKDAGKPCGPLPDGYCIEDPRVKDSPRVVDPARAPLIRRAFMLAGAGRTPGEIARLLNAEGWRTRPRAGTSPKLGPTGGKPIQPCVVRTWLSSPAYKGERAYAAIVDESVWQDAQGTLRSRRERRHGGPTPQATWFLRDIVVHECGSPMYCSKTRRGHRYYVCAQQRLGTGMCRGSVRADVLESVVLLRLEDYVGDIDAWASVRAAARSGRLEKLEAAAIPHACRIWMRSASSPPPKPRMSASSATRTSRTSRSPRFAGSRPPRGTQLRRRGTPKRSSRSSRPSRTRTMTWRSGGWSRCSAR
jgi:Recombinase zinc beta ribbon domain